MQNSPASPGSLWSGIGFGFFGKIPARGDFVRAGLPREFVTPWDDWLQRMLPASRDALGEAWLPAWMEAPVWRFRLRPGVCGPLAALGVLMPSVDRAGRHFPLTLARTAPSLAVLGSGAWLDAAEEIGFAALEQDITPEGLTERLEAAEPAALTDAVPLDLPEGACAWWTAGAPRVAAAAFATAVLPEGSRFAKMLDDHAMLGS